MIWIMCTQMEDRGSGWDDEHYTHTHVDMDSWTPSLFPEPQRPTLSLQLTSNTVSPCEQVNTEIRGAVQELIALV